MVRHIADEADVEKRPVLPDQDQEQGSRLGDFLPAIALAGFGIAGLAIATLFASHIDGQYLVIMPPSIAQPEVLDMVYRAKGGVVGFGGLSNIVIAASDKPDFEAAMRAAGAWLVMPSPRIFGCFIPTEASTP